jgi:hypothetical protein
VKLIPNQVECYAGAKAAETSRRFIWVERTIEVEDQVQLAPGMRQALTVAADAKRRTRK